MYFTTYVSPGDQKFENLLNDLRQHNGHGGDGYKENGKWYVGDYQIPDYLDAEQATDNKLLQWWSNHSKAGDFNPCHKHCNTIFSFAIWLRIPTNYDEQNNNPIASNSNSEGSPRISTFEFQYTDVMGTITPYTYKLCSSNPVSMVLFPGQLIHTVYPFYNCDEDRVSIAGNIGLDTRPGYSGGDNG